MLINPFSFPLSHALHELTIIITSLKPFISSSSMRLSVFISAYIFISICKGLLTVSIFQEIFKLTFICTNAMLKYTLTMLSILNPISLVIVSLWRSPYSKTVFHTIFPISLKNLSIIPSKYSMSLSFTIYKLSCIYSINISLRSRCFHISFILTLKYLFLSNIDALTMFSGLLIHLSKINTFFMFLNFKSRLICYFFKVKVLVYFIIII